MEGHLPDRWLHVIVDKRGGEQWVTTGDDGLGRRKQTKWFIERVG